MYIDDIQEIDKDILRLLEKNARLSYSDIGKEVGLSRVSVKNRIRALEEKGVIEGYKAIINPTGNPSGIKFFLDIETEPEAFKKVVATLQLYKMNRQIYAVSGECCIRVIGYAKDSPTLRELVERMYSNLNGIKRFSINEVLVTYKDADGGVEYVREVHQNKGNTE